MCVQDNVKVAQVRVEITDEAGTVLEAGGVTEAGALWWEYQVIQPLAGELTVTISASDLPGSLRRRAKRKVCRDKRNQGDSHLVLPFFVQGRLRLGDCHLKKRQQEAAWVSQQVQRSSALEKSLFELAPWKAGCFARWKRALHLLELVIRRQAWSFR